MRDFWIEVDQAIEEGKYRRLYITCLLSIKKDINAFRGEAMGLKQIKLHGTSTEIATDEIVTAIPQMHVILSFTDPNPVYLLKPPFPFHVEFQQRNFDSMMDVEEDEEALLDGHLRLYWVRQLKCAVVAKLAEPMDNVLAAMDESIWSKEYKKLYVTMLTSAQDENHNHVDLPSERGKEFGIRVVRLYGSRFELQPTDVMSSRLLQMDLIAEAVVENPKYLAWNVGKPRPINSKIDELGFCNMGPDSIVPALDGCLLFHFEKAINQSTCCDEDLAHISRRDFFRELDDAIARKEYQSLYLTCLLWITGDADGARGQAVAIKEMTLRGSNTEIAPDDYTATNIREMSVLLSEVIDANPAHYLRPPFPWSIEFQRRQLCPIDVEEKGEALQPGHLKVFLMRQLQ